MTELVAAERRIATEPRAKDVLELMAERYALSPEVLEKTVRATCFPADPPATREEFVAGMQIAYRLDLNPLIKEIHFARQRGGGVVAIIGADGWYTLANRQPKYDGCEFVSEFAESKDDKGHTRTLPFAVTCRIHRKDRTHPTEVTEYFAECYRDNSTAWKLTPMRMLRHRAFGQCCRVAFGLAGVMEYDEFLRWQEQAAENDAAARRVLESPVQYEDEPEPKPERGPELRAVIEHLTPPAPPPDSGKKPKTKRKTKEPEPEDDPLVDQDAYLGMLEESMIACRDMENLIEVWADHEMMKARLSLDNQRRADDLHAKHGKRLEGTKA